MHKVLHRFWMAAVLVLAPPLAGAQDPQDFAGLFNAATKSYEARDYKTMERHLRAALDLRPAHPTASYNLASALSLGGKRDTALATLGALARMGLFFDVSKDADFAPLRDLPSFADLIGRFKRNLEPAGSATEAFRVSVPEFIPEGIAYDADTGSYFLGGAHERGIVRIRRGTNVTNFVQPGAGGLLAPLGMQADSRRRLLWVAHAGIPQMRNPAKEDLGRSGIIAYDLDTGQVKRRSMLPTDGAEHLLGDLLLAPDGGLYATDSQAGLLYHFNTSSGQFTPITRPGQLASPQGLALAKDKKTLYIADYTQGLFAFNLEKNTLSRIEVSEDICAYGIDGLYRYENSLIAVQNGIRPHRVMRFTLNESGQRVHHARVLAANLPEFDEPTLGVVVGRRFNFVANSQWNRFDQNHQLPPKEQLRGPVVLRVPIEGE